MSVVVAGFAVAATAYVARYGIQAWQAFKTRPPRLRKFYEGGFQPTMNRREAALILGVRWQFYVLWYLIWIWHFMFSHPCQWGVYCIASTWVRSLKVPSPCNRVYLSLQDLYYPLPKYSGKRFAVSCACPRSWTLCLCNSVLAHDFNLSKKKKIVSFSNMSWMFNINAKNCFT